MSRCLWVMIVFILGLRYLHANNKEQPLFLEKQYERIATLSSQINQNLDLNETEKLDLYNKRGITYLFLEEYDKALSDFNHVLEFSYTSNDVNKNSLAGTGLWGSFFCHAYQNLEKEALEDLDLIRSYFICDCDYASISRRSDSCFLKNKMSLPIQLAANFANPNENISSMECKERVSGTANVIRLCAAKIKSPSLAAAVQYAISELERACCACCDRNHWTDCLGPIVDGWNYVKECMNKGAAIAPSIIWPGR